MSTILIIAGFFVVIFIAGFIIRNLLLKLEKLEEITESQSKYINKFSESVAYCTIRIGQIDEKGIFASDDEIGWWFEEVKNMQNILNQYNSENLVENE
jgi:hypothetical protein